MAIGAEESIRARRHTWGAVVLAIVAVAGVITVVKFGTVSPCGIVRAEVRQQAMREKGFVAAVASILPDSAIDAFLSASYGELTPGRCIAILLNPQPNYSAPAAPLKVASRQVLTVPQRPSVPIQDYTNPLWNDALVALFGPDANTVVEGIRKHSVWLAYPYRDAGTLKYAVFISSVQDNPTTHHPMTCRACRTSIGVVNLEQRGGRWFVESSQPEIGTFGESGKVQPVSSPQRVQLDSNDFALLLNFSSGHMGGNTIGKSLLAHIGLNWRFIGTFVTHEEYSSPLPGGFRYGFDATVSIQKKSLASYPMIRVVRVGTDFSPTLRKVVPVHTQDYVFNGETYVEAGGQH